MTPVDTSRQRVLARRTRPAAARPSPAAIAAAAGEVVRQRGAVAAAELEGLLAARFGLPADDELVLHAVDDALEDDDGGLVMLHPDLIVDAPGLMAGAVLTHRLSAEEREGGYLVVDTDLAGFERVAEPHLTEDEPLEPDELDENLVWVGDEDWLTAHPAGTLLAVRVDADGRVTLEPLDDEPPMPPALPARLREVYDAEPGLPVPAEVLLLGLRHRGALDGPVPPLDDIASVAGLERRGDEYAHAASVWAAGEEADRHWRLLDRLGPGGPATTALEVLDLLAAGDATALRRALDLLEDPDVVEAVTDELLGPDEDPAALVALADRLVAVAGRSPRAAVARWMATVAAERDGRVLDAESHLRAACVEAGGWEFVEDRLAWYEADRGDAAAAVGRWRAIGLPDDDPGVQYVAGFARATGPEPGRNSACWCGSGRKYKQCHAGRPATAPLPERAEWLWHKAIAYLERRGGTAVDALLDSAEALAGADGDLEEALADPVTVDVTLHEEGWFARFLRDRGPLLPEDEAALGASWLDVDRTVYEVLAVRPGEGADLRDLRSGAALTVTGTAGRAVVPGTLLCARAVPDGAGHRFVGGSLPVPRGREAEVLALLDEGSGTMLLEWAADPTTAEP